MAAKRKAGALLQHVLPAKESLNSESADITDDDHFSGVMGLKDADKIKLMVLAWNIHQQNIKGRNGDSEGRDSTGAGTGETNNISDLWASYQSALAAGARRQIARDQSSPILLGSTTTEPGGTHDETSSSAGNGKEDEDGLASDDESDDRIDPQQHDPERLKAFNMFVRLFVDENLDRIIPISKQPKEKIQAIIDSCTRQFPEFAERARKRIRTYLKSCRRNKKVRGENPTTGNNTPSWDSTIRPTPAHLTSVQAEQILAQACENESHNAKRMRLGLEPVSQPLPNNPSGIATDSTANSTVTHPLLGLYNSTVAAAQLQAVTGSSPGNAKNDGQNNASGLSGLLSASLSTPLENGICLNNNNISKTANDNGSINKSSRTSTPSVSASVTDLTTSLGINSLHRFGGSSNALLSTLGAVAGLPGATSNSGSATSAAVAAYQSALFSAAMAAGAHHPSALNFGGLGMSLTGNGPTDLSMKSSSVTQSIFPSTLSSAASALGLSSAAGCHGSQGNTKPLLLSHKLSTSEMAAVRQLITGYRESAAFLMRSADELETLLLQQP